MKKIIYFLVSAILMIIITSGSCKKPKQDPVTAITFQTNPASGSNQAPAPGPDFPLVVTITSTMPSAGVKIEVTARAEGSTTNFFTQSLNTNNTVNNFLITGAPQAVTSVVEVTVSDISNAAVRSTSTYRFSKK